MHTTSETNNPQPNAATNAANEQQQNNKNNTTYYARKTTNTISKKRDTLRPPMNETNRTNYSSIPAHQYNAWHHTGHLARMRKAPFL